VHPARVMFLDHVNRRVGFPRTTLRLGSLTKSPLGAVRGKP
jgi:hypothetical protein